MAKIKQICITLLVACLRAYQLMLSPLLGQRCRFYPTCSQYAIDAMKKYGLWKGTWMAAKRLCRCHPGCEGGFDQP